MWSDGETDLLTAVTLTAVVYSDVPPCNLAARYQNSGGRDSFCVLSGILSIYRH
jgi:hypothetical protein